MAAIRNMCIFASSRAGRAIKLVSSSTPAGEGGAKMVPKHLGGILGGQLSEYQGGRERSLNGSFLWARAMAGWVRRGRPALPACEMDVWRPNVPDNALLSRIFAFYLLIAMQFQSME